MLTEKGGRKTENLFQLWSERQPDGRGTRTQLNAAGLGAGEGAGAYECRWSLSAGKGRTLILPWSLKMNGYHDLSQWDPCWTSDLPNYRTINLCCFKPRSLWLFVTAITEELRNFVVFILNEEMEKSLLKPLDRGEKKSGTWRTHVRHGKKNGSCIWFWIWWQSDY